MPQHDYEGSASDIVGFCLSFTLVGLSGVLLEAASWATLIERSGPTGRGDNGVRLREFCVQADEPKSVYAALTLLWRRWRRINTPSRLFWSGYILLFVFSVMLSGALSFILGRTIDIATMIGGGFSNGGSQVAITGDLTDLDLQNIANNKVSTWNADPFAALQSLPRPQFTSLGKETLYYTEVTPSHVKLFNTSTTPGRNTPMDLNAAIQPDTVLIFPKWVLRTHCERIPNLERNILTPSKNFMTYVFTPRNVVERLFDSFDLPIPSFIKAPLNLTATLYKDDVIPPTMDVSNIMSGIYYPDDGSSVAINSSVVSRGEDGRSFITLENVLVRLNSSYAPNGTFAFRSPENVPDRLGHSTFIGLDAAVCLQVCDPWMFSVYNSSRGSPVAISWRKIAKSPFTQEYDPLELNFTRARNVYFDAHSESINWQVQMVKSGESWYGSSLPLVSFTNGTGKDGYTEFSAALYASARSRSDTVMVLPYLVGSGPIQATRLVHTVDSVVSVRWVEFSITMVIVFITGFVCTFFVPRLPMGVPKRGFNLYSWILAFHARELEIEEGGCIFHGMTLDNMRIHGGNAILRYRFPEKEDKQDHCIS